MSSDEAYSAFLDQANQDTGAVKASSQDKTKSASATASKGSVHTSIANVDAYYTSDSDEPFEPVSFDWDGGDSLDEYSFEQLLSADADVSQLSPQEFDPHNKYAAVLEAVAEAAGAGKSSIGPVYIFRVDFGGTRLEYYVVAIAGKNGKSGSGGQVQGLKALAIES